MIKKLAQFLSAGLLTLAVAVPALSVETDTSVIYYHHDVRGDPVVVTTEEGNVLWMEAYRAYGSAEDRVSSSGIGFGDNASENHASRLGYTGHQSDSGSSLTYMQQRHYDPVIGRFMSNDPVGFQLGNTAMFNRYAYANNNPYKYVDPDGRESKKNDWEELGMEPPPNYYNTNRDEVANAINTGVEIVDQELTNPTNYASAASGGLFANLVLKIATRFKRGSSAAGNAAKGVDLNNIKYDSRVRARGVDDPTSHNFPYSFDKEILSTKPIPKENGYTIYRKEGTMAGKTVTDPETGVKTQQYKEGVFEIGVTKDGIVDHRFFRPNK